MIVLLGILQLIIIIWNCIYELRNKSISVFLWATLLIMFGIMHFLSILTNSYTCSKKTMNEASIFVILFSAIYFIIRYIMIRNKKNKNETNKKSPSDILNNDIEIKQFMYILFILLILVTVIRMVGLIRGAGGIFNTSWETMRSTVVGNKSYVSFSQIFLSLFYVGSTCMILAIITKNKKILIASIGIILLEVMVSRNRVEILPIIVTVIYYYINKKDKISIKMLLTLGLIGIVSIYFIYGIRVFRRSGTMENFLEQYNFKSFNNEIINYLEEDDGELGLRKYFYYFIENNNNFNNFNKGHTYIRMLLVLVPSKFSFGLKPDDFAVSMGTAVDRTIKGLSIHPTMFGDVYANFGLLGFGMGMFWAIYAGIIDKLCNNKNIIKKSIYSITWGICFIIQARGSVYNAFASAIYSIIILKILYLIFKWVKNSVENNNNKELFR